MIVEPRLNVNVKDVPVASKIQIDDNLGKKDMSLQETRHTLRCVLGGMIIGSLMTVAGLALGGHLK